MKKLLLLMMAVVMVGCQSISLNMGSIEIGMTEAEAVSLLGKPKGIEDNGQQRILKFRNVFTFDGVVERGYIVVEQGRVVRFGNGISPYIDPNPNAQRDFERNWNHAVASGMYTYEIAIKDLGPPSEEVTLDDGGKVCTWRSSRSGSGSTITLNNGLASGSFNSFVSVFQLNFSRTNRGSLVLTAWRTRVE